MKRIQPFSLFEALTQVPSHEELSQLKEFQRMKWANPQWITGKRAYDNGTRKIRFKFYSPSGKYTFDGIRGFDSEYSIYPQKGTLSDGTHSVIRGLKFDTLDDWNESFLQINGYLIANALFNFTQGSNRVPFVRALKGNAKIKDTETLIKTLKHPTLREIVFDVYDVLDLIERIEDFDASEQIQIIKHLPLDKQEEVQKKLGISSEDVKSLSNLGNLGFFD